MPAGVLVTVPDPDVVTVSRYDATLKLAVTAAPLFVAIVHGAVPAQPPPVQPSNVEPAAAAPVSVTRVPEANVAEQVLPQLIPAGELVTVPAPLPVLVADTLKPVVPPTVAQASAEYGEVPLAS